MTTRRKVVRRRKSLYINIDGMDFLLHKNEQVDVWHGDDGALDMNITQTV